MFELDGLEVSGVSVGGVASCIDLPALKVCVDVGVILDRTVARDVVLITHAHADHLGSLVQHVAQRGLRGMPPATYVCLLYTSPSPRDGLLSRMPSSA